MEISGSVLRRGPICSGAGFRQDAAEALLGVSVARARRVSMRPKGGSCGGGIGFSDEGHLRYYLPPVRCGGRKKEEEKRAKLVKELSKDLSAFYSIGFGVEVGDGATGDVKGKMMTEAVELLLSQLKQLKSEEKELKKKYKQEKAAMKAARMRNNDTSSSSSESSDSDCKTVVRMSNLITETKPRISAADPIPALCTTSTISSSRDAVDKIEVCMGGKCKKSGAVELMEEFEKRVGVEAAVVGCKCMGKCRDGPNVRVLNQEEGSMKTSRNPLCIGVGLEDVGAIVANFFGKSRDAGLLAA